MHPSFTPEPSRLLSRPDALIHHVTAMLQAQGGAAPHLNGGLDTAAASAVLLLLGRGRGRWRWDPCLILNKRSRQVRQPGDLCCPGGGIMPRVDKLLGGLLTVQSLSRHLLGGINPGTLTGMPPSLRLLLATGMREGFEEMRLNPFRLRFLGSLPPVSLRMFRRVIYPMACWVDGQRRFRTNWEVEKVLRIPLRALLAPTGYARYRLHYAPAVRDRQGREWEDFPCFIFHHRGSRELLWGATYRIVIRFLELVFGFTPPPSEGLPVIPGVIRESYIQGNPTA